MSPSGLIPRGNVDEAPGTSIVMKSDTWALTGTSSVSMITSAEQATTLIVRMAGFSLEFLRLLDQINDVGSVDCPWGSNGALERSGCDMRSIVTGCQNVCAVHC